MNTRRAFWIPILELAILGLILLAIVGLAILVFVAMPVIHIPSSQPPIKADPLNLVNEFHDAVNSGSLNAMLELFAEDATINDGELTFNGRDEIQDWAVHSPYMAGLHLTMISSQVAGERVFWRDLATNEQSAPVQPYILQWRAVTQNGKIKTLTVTVLPMPDRK